MSVVESREVSEEVMVMQVIIGIALGVGAAISIVDLAGWRSLAVAWFFCVAINISYLEVMLDRRDYATPEDKRRDVWELSCVFLVLGVVMAVILLYSRLAIESGPEEAEA